MLPREVQAEHWPDRATFDFPVRPIGKVRYVGLGLIGFAVLFAWSPSRQVFHLLKQAISGQANLGDWIAGGFTLLFVLAALVPFGLGLFILAGRTRLKVLRERLIITECAGPFRWSRRFRLADLERLEIAGAKTPPANQPQSTPLGGLGALAAKLRNGKTALVLLGYPREWLDGMAQELSGLTGIQGRPVPVTQVTPTEQPVSAGTEEVVERPVESNARVVERPGALEAEIPSRGFFKESHGFFIFGILWCLVTGLISFLFARDGLRSGSFTSGALLFGLIFWGIGLGMVLLGIHLGTRCWTLKSDGFRFEAVRRSALRRRQWTWNASELREIRVGPSGVEVNNRPLEELQVYPQSGKKTGLLGGRNHAELAWLATLLRRSLRLQPVTEDRDTTEKERR